MPMIWDTYGLMWCLWALFSFARAWSLYYLVWNCAYFVMQATGLAAGNATAKLTPKDCRDIGIGAALVYFFFFCF